MEACEELNWSRQRSTPRGSETNGTADRAVRRVKGGTSSVLVQSGLQERCWAEAMDCCGYHRNVQEVEGDGQAPNECRFNSPREGLVIPGRSKFLPISAKDQGRQHQFGTNVPPGIFMRYVFESGREVGLVIFLIVCT